MGSSIHSGRVALASGLCALLFPSVLGCGSGERVPDARVTNALTESVAGLRVSLGQRWGRPIPGLAAAAALDADTPPAVAVSGSAAPPGAERLGPRDRFHIGSITKTFTAALVMQLDQEGLISLDDPISRWIDYPGGERITVAMLLGHTSGIADFTDDPAYRSLGRPQEMIALAARLPRVFAPGARWAYSNTNYTMLGVIAEKATGSTWEREVDARFLRPLGLRDTYLWTGAPEPPTVDGSRLACGGAGEPACAPPRPGLPLLAVTAGPDWVIAWSAGSLVSTPSDVTRWLRALVAGDVLDAGHRALMTTPTPQSVAALRSLPAFGRLRWTGAGLGLFRYEVTSRGVGWGHEGLIDGFTANAVHMVDDGATVAVTSNFQMTDSFAALGAVVSSLPASGSDTAHQRWPTTHAYRPGPRMHPGPAQQVGTVGA